MRDRAIGQSAALAGGGSGTAPTITSISNPDGKDTSVTVTGYTAAEMAAMANGTWSGHALVNTSVATRTDHLVVYTDIEDPKKRQFYDFDGNSDTPPAYADPVEGTDDFEPLPIVLGDAPAAIDSGYRFHAGNLDLTIFPAAGAASGGSVTKTFTANTKADGEGPAEPNKVVSLPGIFDGARGTYSCTGTQTDSAGPFQCVVTVTPAGGYSSDNAWTFAPNPGQMAYHEDSEYVTFGWWLREPAKSTGAYSFAAFYSGTDVYVPTEDASITGGDTVTDDGAPVTGEAIYTGNAAGRYVVGNEAGAFTASASLTAKFGGATAAATSDRVGSISGSITNFQGEAGGMSGWMVELKKINLMTLNTMEDPTTEASEAFATTVTNPSLPTYNGTVATLGDATAHGSWQGRFYGNAKNPDMPGQDMENAQPLAVGGMFNADGADANIAGAFGARRP